MAALLLAAVLSYLAGSVPTAYLAVRVVKGKDIRELGSGNVGATNTLRLLGPGPALGVAIVDFAKGFLPVFLVNGGNFPLPGSLPGIIAGTAAMAGHLFPLYIGFKGGKGVATGAGVLTALFAPLFPAGLAVFGLALFLFRRASVASIAAAVSMPLSYAGISLVLGESLDPALLTYTLFVPVLVIVSHRRNIKALFEGRESRLF